MEFQTPNGLKFSIPDEWWTFADMAGFALNGYQSFGVDPLCHGTVELVEIGAVEPPTRNAGVELLKKSRIVPILFAISDPNGTLPPIEVHRCKPGGQFVYKVCNGYHRYYATVAAGFPCLPVVIREPFVS